jgi:hypothetical protein
MSRPWLGVAATLLAAAFALGLADPARAAADDPLPDELMAKKKKKKKKKSKKKEGWNPALKAGLNFAFSQNQGVVGIPDGVTVALGLQIDGKLLYRRGNHEWLSELGILHTQSKVPNVDPFVKAADQFILSTLYQYRFKPRVPWLGVFGGVRLNTALLPGNLVRTEDTTLELQYRDGRVEPDTAPAQERYRLTDSFAPLLFKQFAGALLNPLERDWLEIDVRFGLGAVEVWTRDGFVIDDDDATADVLELKQLQDYVQGGVELHLDLSGTVVDKILSYGLHLELMYPFAHNADTDLEGIALFNTELKFTLNVKVFEWASLNYALSVVRTPLIVDKWQVVNSLMLSLTANIVK